MLDVTIVMKDSYNRIEYSGVARSYVDQGLYILSYLDGNYDKHPVENIYSIKERKTT
jgi:hypothetical protein